MGLNLMQTVGGSEENEEMTVSLRNKRVPGGNVLFLNSSLQVSVKEEEDLISTSLSFSSKRGLTLLDLKLSSNSEKRDLKKFLH
ncbi:hypothetical protein Tco_0721958 [Tanacetum coccineum]